MLWWSHVIVVSHRYAAFNVKTSASTGSIDGYHVEVCMLFYVLIGVEISSSSFLPVVLTCSFMFILQQLSSLWNLVALAFFFQSFSRTPLLR
jgi:hypothetical protein